MVFWVLAAIMTVVVVLALTRPLMRGPIGGQNGEPPDQQADLNVYRDQLNEVDADCARGLISAADAEAARLEISRRILKADAEGSGAPTSASLPGLIPRQFVSVVLSAVLPLIGIGLYMTLGAPGLPDQPRAARLNTPPDQVSLQELISRVEARLREAPDDAQGWAVIAPIYLRQGRFEDAGRSFERAIQLRGRQPDLLIGLGQAMVGASEGAVPDAALKLFQEASALDAKGPEARFWIAIAYEQRGMLLQARQVLEELRAKFSDNRELEAAISSRISTIERSMKAGGATPGAGRPEGVTGRDRDPSGQPGPTSDDVDAAAKLSPDDRMAMIRSMVEGLDARLQADGSNAAGWQRLIQSYMVLGEREKAEGAVMRARAALGSNAEGLGQIDELAKRLGLAGN